MYSLQKLVHWIKIQIDRERADAYNAIIVIIIGFVIGLIIAYILCLFIFSKIHFLSVILKISGLGIPITTVITVFYYLYKSEETETRKSNFLEHVNRELSIDDKTNLIPNIKPEIIEEIIINILKSNIAETAKIKTEEKEEGKKNNSNAEQ